MFEMLGTEAKYLAGHPEVKFWQLCKKIVKN